MNKTNSKSLIYLFLFLLFYATPQVLASQYNDLLQEYQNVQPQQFYTNHIVTTKINPAVLLPVTAPPPATLPDSEFKTHHFFSLNPDFLGILETNNTEKKFLEIASSPLTLNNLLTLVALRNPTIKASEKQVDAARQTIRQAANLDAILKQYAAFSNALSIKVGPMKGEMVQEKFPFPALASLKGRIAGQNVLMALEKLEITRRTVLTLSQKQFWNLFYNREAQKLTTQMIQLLEHLETVARSRYETGMAGFQELIQVQITLETLKVKRTTLKESQGSINEQIKQLIDLPDLKQISISKIQYLKSPLEKQITATSLPKLYSLGQRYRQELRLLRSDISKTELLIYLAESMILPPLTLNLANFTNKAIKQVGSDALEESFAIKTTAQTGAGLPKEPWFGTNDAFLHRTRHLLAAKKDTLHNLESATKALIRERWFNLDKANRDVTLYRNKIIDLSQAALEVVTQGYETGDTPFAQVNLSYQNWLNSRLTLVKRISDAGITMSRLTESLGTQDITP